MKDRKAAAGVKPDQRSSAGNSRWMTSLREARSLPGPWSERPTASGRPHGIEQSERRKGSCRSPFRPKSWLKR